MCFKVIHGAFHVIWAESKLRRAATHCSLVLSFNHSLLQNSNIRTMVFIWNLMEVLHLPQKWLRIHIYNSCAQPIKSPSPFRLQKFKDRIVSAKMAGTWLAWLLICSIKSTTAASTYPDDYGKIKISYTTNPNMSMIRSSLLFSIIYLTRKSNWTHSFFPFSLVTKTRRLASTFIIYASFFLKETFLAFFQKTLSGFNSDILSRAMYSSTVGVRSSWLKVKHW